MVDSWEFSQGPNALLSLLTFPQFVQQQSTICNRVGHQTESGGFTVCHGISPVTSPHFVKAFLLTVQSEPVADLAFFRGGANPSKGA